MALNSHDGPLYLEQPNHIPEEYHKYFGIQPMISSPRSEFQPMISSPRSESNTLATNDDENSNSMMSANSEKEGLGAQMVLEQNLGVCPEDEEDSNSNSKKQRHESSNSKMDSLLEDHESHKEAKIATSIAVSEMEPSPKISLPSFSSIIAGSPKAELQDILVPSSQTETGTPQDLEQGTEESSGSRRASLDNESRPSLDQIRRCSLDQMVLNSPGPVNRRASIDIGHLESFGISTVAEILQPLDQFSAPVASICKVQSLTPSGPPSVQGPRHNSMPSSPLRDQGQTQNSSNFLISELESVLGSAGDFTFTTPSPEKLLTSIPPSSMMIKTDADEKAKKGQRTDFLGAFKESKEASKEQDGKDEDIGNFDDGQNIIRSTLADVTHPVSFSNSTLQNHEAPKQAEERDSLSQLLDEMTDQANQDKETK